MSASLQRRERPREAVCPVSVSYCSAQLGDPSLETQILPEACSAPGDNPPPKKGGCACPTSSWPHQEALTVSESHLGSGR